MRMQSHRNMKFRDKQTKKNGEKRIVIVIWSKSWKYFGQENKRCCTNRFIITDCKSTHALVTQASKLRLLKRMHFTLLQCEFFTSYFLVWFACFSFEKLNIFVKISWNIIMSASNICFIQLSLVNKWEHCIKKPKHWVSKTNRNSDGCLFLLIILMRYKLWFKANYRTVTLNLTGSKYNPTKTTACIHIESSLLKYIYDFSTRFEENLSQKSRKNDNESW